MSVAPIQSILWNTSGLYISYSAMYYATLLQISSYLCTEMNKIHHLVAYSENDKRRTGFYITQEQNRRIKNHSLYPVTLSLKRPRQVARWFDYIRTLTQTHKIVIHFNMIKYTCYISSLFYLKRAFRRKSRKLRDCLKYKSIRKNKDIYEAWEFAWKA